MTIEASATPDAADRTQPTGRAGRAARAGPGRWTVRRLPAADSLAVGAVLLLVAPVLWPLLGPGLPATHDGLLHVQRLIALDAGVRQGEPFLRWLPDLAYGLGQPLFLYYAPLSYLPALAVRLLGAGYVASFEAAGGLAIVLAALAMYACARALVGPLAAAAAAVVYATLPYQLVDLYVRGALAESWAFVWLPLSTLFLVRAWDAAAQPRWSVGLALALAGLVLTHNVTALLFLPALLALAAVLLVRAGGSGPGARFSVPLRPLLATGLGLLLSAWFWLPALAERGLVQIEQTLEPDLFASFFVRSWPPFRLDLLYDYERPVSTALGAPIFWPQLGLVQAVIVLVAAVGALTAGRRRRGVAAWALALVGGSYLLQLGPLAPLYEVVPLLAFVQFPWRLLTLLGLGTAILVGLFVDRIGGHRARRLAVAAVIVTSSVVTAIGQLDPPVSVPDERHLTVESIIRAELADHSLGTTHSGEYLPVASGQRNASRLRKTLIDGGARPAGTPLALRVTSASWRPDRIALTVDAPAAERLTFRQFQFPGWVARVDDEERPLAPGGPLGLLAVEVPAGVHQVEVSWEWTPLRATAASASIVALLLLFLLGTRDVRRIAPRRVLLGVATIGLVASLIGPAPAPAPLGPAAAPAVAPGDVPLSLLGSQHDASRLAAERRATVRLLWLVRDAPAAPIGAAVEVVAAGGAVHRASWAYEAPSRLWQRGEVVSTVVAVRLPSEFPPGPAGLRLAFGRPGGSAVDLGSIDVPPATGAAASAGAAPDVATDIAVGEAVRLGPPAHWTGSATARAGRSVDVPLRWRAAATPELTHELLAVAALATPTGEVVSPVGRPGDWFAPLPFWQAGDVVEQRLRMGVPAATPAGQYPLRVRVYRRDLGRGGISEPGAADARVRGQPVAELPLGTLTVVP